jgi:hypothetical protein
MRAKDLPGAAAALTRQQLASAGERLAEQRGRPFVDEGRRARARLLGALQYDRRAEDAPLLRALFDAEVTAEEEDDGGPALRRAAFLVARLRDAADLHRFVRAKTASFDTSCGFERAYLFSAGIDAALVALGALEEPARGRARDLMLHEGAALVSPEDLEAWWADQEAAYPARWQEESVHALLELALEWEEGTWASSLLDVLEHGEGPAYTSSAAHLRGVLGQHAAAAALWGQLVERATRAEERSRALRKQAGSLLAAGQPDAAAAVVVDAIEPTCEEPDWRRLGSGRMLVSEGFAIAVEMACGPSATALVRRFDRLAGELASAPLELLERAASATARHGLPERAEHYRVVAAVERERIGALLK